MSRRVGKWYNTGMSGARTGSGPSELVVLRSRLQPDDKYKLPALSRENQLRHEETVRGMNESGICSYIAAILSLDEKKGEQVTHWVHQNIQENTGKERDLVLALIPLQEAQIEAGNAIAVLRKAQDRHRAEGYEDRKIPFVVEAREGIQRQFLEDYGYKPPKGFHKNEIPIGTTLELDTVDMAMLLDMSRHADGTIDEDMLCLILGTQGSNQYTDEYTMKPWVNDGLREIRENMQKYYCGGAGRRKFISSRIYQSEITLKDASEGSTVLVPRNKAVEMIEVLDKLREIVTVEADNFILLQKTGGIPYESKAQLTERIARMKKACHDGKEKWDTRFAKDDAEKMGKYLCAVASIDKELNRLGEQIGIRVREFVEEVGKRPEQRLRNIAHTIVKGASFYDTIYVKDSDVQDEWAIVVEAMRNLTDIERAVEEKMIKIFRAKSAPATH